MSRTRPITTPSDAPDRTGGGGTAAGPVPTLLAFQAHVITPGVVRQFERLRRAAPPHVHPVWLMHVPAGTPKPARLHDVPHHFVTTPDIRIPEYTGKSAGGAEWSIWAGGHTDLPALHLYRERPGYGRYWLVEYDVRWSGRWADFFAAFEANDADLLATSIRSVARDPTWWIWDTLMPPEGGEVVPDHRPEDRMAAFMPLFRASRRAMETMDRAYREGWGGHIEATWPTILRGAGLVVEDIGGKGEFVAPANRGRFYEADPTTVDLSPGTFVFRPAKWPVPRLRRNRLWHPVKPLDLTLGVNARDHYWELRRTLRRWGGKFASGAGAPSSRSGTGAPPSSGNP